MSIIFTAELPQGVLEALREGLEVLREADGGVLPVGVGEDEVEQDVVKRLARYGDFQLVHVGEVGLREHPGLVNLGEEHLSRRPFGCPPDLYPPLERPQLAVLESAWVLLLQVLEDGPGLQAVVGLEHLEDFVLYLTEGVLPAPPEPFLPHLAGQYFRVPPFARGVFAHSRFCRSRGKWFPFP